MNKRINPSAELNIDNNSINKDNKNSSQPQKQENISNNNNDLLLSEKTSKNKNDTKKTLDNDKKRHRRSKFESNSRDFICPECQKCYLSSSALKNHRKNKHDYGIDDEKKGRGRPKKELIKTDYMNNTKEKYEKFFNIQDNTFTNNDKEINIDFIKSIFNVLFDNYKNELYNINDNIENNSFYNLVINNWNNSNNNLEEKSYRSMINCIQGEEILNKPPIDTVFFLYMKYLFNKVNKDYFTLCVKYLIIFREYINREKKEEINKKYIDENKKEYTQIYNAEIIPDLFNDFLIDFMESNNYFGLDKDEIIKIIEYFCFWLNLEGYTDSHISKIE